MKMTRMRITKFSDSKYFVNFYLSGLLVSFEIRPLNDICVASLKIRHLTLLVEIELNAFSISKHFHGYLEKIIIQIVQKLTTW